MAGGGGRAAGRVDAAAVSGVGDVLGCGGANPDPLWRIRVQLTGLERELMACWPVRRLAHVAHAGVAAALSTQTCSRLEHSLGLLALVAHFTPEDRVTRANLERQGGSKGWSDDQWGRRPGRLNARRPPRTMWVDVDRRVPRQGQPSQPPGPVAARPGRPGGRQGTPRADGR